LTKNLFDHLEKIISFTAKIYAYLGGFILLVLTILTTLTVIGRNLIELGLGPIPGDFELVEMGMAFAVTAFLPWCQLTHSHASVDLLKNKFGAIGNRYLSILSNLLMFCAAIFITWRLWVGLIDKSSAFFPEVSQILSIPIWYAYAACFSGLCIFTCACGLTLLKAVRGR